MDYLSLESALSQAVLNCFGHHHRPMSPSGAPDSNGEVTLALAPEQRQQLLKQINEPADSLLHFAF